MSDEHDNPFEAFWSPPEPDDVPAILRSDYSGLPFAKCLVCETALEETEVHVVEKVVRNGETVIEMAMCAACCADVAEQLSAESTQVLRSVQEEWAESGDPDGEACANCHRPRAHDGGFVIAGYFLTDRVLLRQIAVCEPCHDAVQQRLSRATRDTFGRFVGDHFPGVPENIDAPSLLV